MIRWWMVLVMGSFALHATGGALLGSPGEAAAVLQEGAANPVESGDPGEGVRTVQAERLIPGEVIRIDGNLDEEVWERARPITEFVQQDPVEGASPSRRTEVRIVFDEDNLYIGALLEDDPEGILAYQRRRNAGLGTDDRFMWILDTFGDGRTGYFFEVNPAGLMGDGLIGGGGGFGVNKSWDGIWEVRTRIHDAGWTAEIRIPFSTLDFDPDLDAWGINFQRTIRRWNEEMVWSGFRRNQPLTRPVHAGRLEGLQGISQGRGLEVRPYATGGWTRVPADADPRDLRSKVGGDLSYSITPSLRGALTVNTDFAEVEADQRRVNLSRFPISFPEQRDFFLEGSGVFSFAPRHGVNPFFSRRIGLADGEEIPIEYGARLGGQAGRYELGFYQVRTGRADFLDPGVELFRHVPREDFTVARVRRSLFDQSHVGVLYTRRATHGPGEGEEAAPPDRHTVGADFDFYTSNLLGRYNFQFEGFMVLHTDPVGEGSSGFADRRARGIRVNFPNDVWSFHASLRDFGEAFDPAVGFTRRNGFRRFQPTVAYAPRPSQIPQVRQFEWAVEFEYLTDLSGRLLTRNTDVTLLEVAFESGDRFQVQAGRSFERLDRRFRIHGEGDASLWIEPGDYATTGWSTAFRTAGRRALSGNASLAREEFWSGERARYEAGMTARPLPGVSLTGAYQVNDVSLPLGDFRTNLIRVGGSWDASPLTSLGMNLQYDDVSEVVGLFTRLRWIVRPGSDVFLVYTHNWLNHGGRLLGPELATLSQGGNVKVNYSYRF